MGTKWARERLPNIRTAETIFLGGDFTSVSLLTGKGTVVDINSGEPNLKFPAVSRGFIRTSIPDGSGGWYIGGTFKQIGDFNCNGLAHLHSDGSPYQNWAPIIQGDDPIIRTISISGNNVYIGGRFSSVGEYTRNNLAALDAISGDVIDWDPNADNEINSIAIYGDLIYVGGDFTLIGSQSRNFIAALDLHGNATDWNPSADEPVRCLVVNEASVFVGGGFHLIYNKVRNLVAEIDRISGEPTDWDPNITAGPQLVPVVNSLLLSTETLFIGGGFQYVGEDPRLSLAEIYLDSGRPTDWDPSCNGTVYSLSRSERTIYVGGLFNYVGGTERKNAAEIEISTGAITQWIPDPNTWVLTVSRFGSEVYLGGDFIGLKTLARNYIAAIDANTGAIKDWNPNITSNDEQEDENFYYYDKDRSEIEYSMFESFNPSVQAMAISGSTLYFGGHFSNVGGSSRNNLAAVNINSGAVTPWDPNVTNSVAPSVVYVDNIILSGNTVFIAGCFEEVKNVPQKHIAKIDLSSGNLITWNRPNPNNQVNAIALSGSTLYLGGGFEQIGTSPRSRLAALDISTGELLTEWTPSASGDVYSLVIHDSKIYVGGEFYSIDNNERPYVAELELESGSVTNWTPGQIWGAGSYIGIKKIIVSGSYVYAGGYFGHVGLESRNSLAAFQLSDRSLVDWDPHIEFPEVEYLFPHGAIYSINQYGGKIYIGGYFSIVQGNFQPYFSTLTAEGMSLVTDEVVAGWQTLSVPVVVTDFSKTAVWPTAISEAFKYTPTGYQPVTALENCEGYYLRFGSQQNLFYVGQEINECSVPVRAGWNIIGSLSEDIPILTNVCLYPDTNSFVAPTYIFQNTYITTNNILAAKGHWVKVKYDGEIYFSSEPIQCNGNSAISIQESQLDHFKITDAEGREQSLYVANSSVTPSLIGIGLSMPPALPEQGFDARISPDDYIKVVSPDSGEVDMDILVSAPAYPITLSWELNPDNGLQYSFIPDSGLGKSQPLNNSGIQVLTKSNLSKIHLITFANKITQAELPIIEYSLGNCYPNPFNPSTKINFSVAKEGQVNLSVFNILGEKVAELKNETMRPGNYELDFNASSLASGIYLYRLVAGDYLNTKKMVVIK